MINLRRPLIPLPLALAAAAVVTPAFSIPWPLTVEPSRWAVCALLTFAALLPVAGLMYAFYAEDRLEAEPPRNLARYFAIGVLSLSLVWVWHAAARRVLPDGVNMPTGALTELLRFVLVVGLGEELCKYLCFRAAAAGDAELDEPYDACLYAAYVGMGFAGLENLNYVVDPSRATFSLGVAALRAATAVPAHALFCATWGVAFGLVKIGARPWWWLPAALALSAFAHGLYDWIALHFARLDSPLLGLLALLALLAALAWLCAHTVPLARRLSPHRRG